MNIVLEELKSDDCALCSDIEASCFGSESMSIDDLLQTSEDNNKAFYVAKCDGNVVGLCGILIAIDSADILTIAVSEEYRRSGIGRLLLDRALSTARERGVSSILLEVRASNASAIAFYENHGFERISIRKSYYREPSEDAVIMSLKVTFEE